MPFKEMGEISCDLVVLIISVGYCYRNWHQLTSGILTDIFYGQLLWIEYLEATYLIIVNSFKVTAWALPSVG